MYFALERSLLVKQDSFQSQILLQVTEGAMFLKPPPFLGPSYMATKQQEQGYLFHIVGKSQETWPPEINILATFMVSQI